MTKLLPLSSTFHWPARFSAPSDRSLAKLYHNFCPSVFSLGTVVTWSPEAFAHRSLGTDLKRLQMLLQLLAALEELAAENVHFHVHSKRYVCAVMPSVTA